MGENMTLQQVVNVIRRKFLEEKQGMTDGPVAQQYRDARDSFPVTMATAQGVWNLEAAKSS
jgi:hypothetical protein